MPKAEAKNAVKYTRMCKFWRTNECKSGEDCTFAHSTAELRASPKPCFGFVKNGFCARGEGCRFVHELAETKLKSQDQISEVFVGRHFLRQPAYAPEDFGQGFGADTSPFLATYLPVPSPFDATGPGRLALHEPGQTPSGNSFLGPDPSALATKISHTRVDHTNFQPTCDADSHSSSLSDVSYALVHDPLSVLKEVEEGWLPDDITVATQSVNSTMYMSQAPSVFSENDSPHFASFWL